MRFHPIWTLCQHIAWACVLCIAAPASAQPPQLHTGETVSREVREIYDRGLAFLVKSQSERGDWPNDGYSGPGTTGMALMVLLASGEDPNFGPHSVAVRRALRNLIDQQDASTGFFGNSMYHHGFAMLALAEAYGAVDQRRLADGGTAPKRSVGEALELAVRCALTSQEKNPLGAWRYSPDARDADTSVAGAILVGLLAARNAGIEVPDAAIDRAIGYFTSMTSESGQVAYAGGFGGFDESLARISIASLSYAIARRKDLPQYKSTLAYLTDRLEQAPHHYVPYTQYYQAQALLQGSPEDWKKWNQLLIRKLKEAQQDDGSIRGEFGKSTTTALSLLALAVNYRFLPIYER
jgi:hypothetical protein